MFLQSHFSKNQIIKFWQDLLDLRGSFRLLIHSLLGTICTKPIFLDYYSLFLLRLLHPGNSLAVQWLGLHTSTAVGLGSIPGRITKIPQAACSIAKNNNKFLKIILLHLYFYSPWALFLSLCLGNIIRFLRRKTFFTTKPLYSKGRHIELKGRNVQPAHWSQYILI